MSPAEFMTYATPLVLLIAHVVSEVLAHQRASNLSDQTSRAAALLANKADLQTFQVVSQVKATSH